MRKIRLGVIFDQKIHGGGGYQQALNALLLCRNLPENLVETIYFTIFKDNIVPLAEKGIYAKHVNISYFEKVKSHFRRKIIDASLLKLIRKFNSNSALEKLLKEYRIDLIYFLSPTSLAQSIEELNYISTVWDLSHRDDPEFPEVRSNRELERRDRNYSAILPRATAVFVDSELGKKNVVHRYGLDAKRIHVMPFQAAEATRRLAKSIEDKRVNILDKYNLSTPYVFYPAQYWAHKNHVYLLEGLLALEKEYGLSVGAIFSGGDQGNQSYIKGYVKKLGLEDRVRFAGFVNNEDIISLYRQSIALVMPSYFGPTNLPPLEAFELGVPVLYSDKDGLRDQVGNAALLMDLKNPSSMATHIKNLYFDINLRKRLIAAGYKRLKSLEEYDRNAILIDVLKNFQARRCCWE